MDISTPQRVKRHPASTSGGIAAALWRRLRYPSTIAWLLLPATLVGFCFFAIQVALVPQEHDYPANWHGAEWISAPGTASAASAVSYFRKTIALEAVPDNAFVTVQGSQTYALFVNDVLVVDTNSVVRSTVAYPANMYDVTAFLQPGANAIALRAINNDAGAAAVRVALGMDYGTFQQMTLSGDTWRATSDPSQLATPATATAPDWKAGTYDDSSWPTATPLTTSPVPDGTLPYAPVTFESPVPSTWIIASSSSNGFFYSNLLLPSFQAAWLRVTATGFATVYLNGHTVVAQPATIQQDQSGRFPPNAVHYTAGIYHVAPYLHAGANTIAVHVVSPGFDRVNGSARPAGLALDITLTDGNHVIQRVQADKLWRTSPVATPGWAKGDGTTGWASAIPVHSATLTALPVYKIPATELEQTTLTSMATTMALVTLILLLLIVLSVLAQRALAPARLTVAAAIDRAALGFAPVAAVMLLLFVISRQPILPNPFPFTPGSLALLAGIALLGQALVLVTSRDNRQRISAVNDLRQRISDSLDHLPFRPFRPVVWATVVALVIAAIGLYVVTYHLDYESYWQDELASIQAAQGVVNTGLPRWPTGFMYTKAELFSYMLAVVIRVFGTDPGALRMVSALEFVVSLVLVYLIGSYFINRRAGLIASAMMLFNPLSLWWARQARMYQQAQLFVLLVVYLFYRAVQPNAKTRYIYLSMAATVAMYLSHEETFIVLPAMLIYFLVTQRLTWMRNKHWWIAGFSAIAVCALQLIFWRVTRRPILGTDHSVLPLIHFSPSSIRYYSRLLFSIAGYYSGSLVNFFTFTALSIAGTLIGIFGHNRQLRYLSVFLWIPFAVLCFLLSVLNDRYLVPILPLFAMLSAAALVMAIDKVAALSRARIGGWRASVLSGVFGALIVVAVLASLVPSISSVSLATSRALGLPYHHVKPNYRDAGIYIQEHWRPGDVMISMAPIGDVMFYARTPDYKVYQNKVLTLFEYQGHIIDNRGFTYELLNVNDFNEALRQHHRIWLFSSTGHTCCVGSAGTTPITQNFTLVFEGQGAYVYLHTG